MRTTPCSRIAKACLLSLFAWMQPAHAQTAGIVSMVLGEGLQQEDHSGFYGTLMDAILDETGVPAVFDVLPFKRALKSFEAGQHDCIWGLDAAFLSGFGLEDVPLAESAMVLESRQYLFVAEGRTGFADLSDLAGRTVGVLNGANTEPLFADLEAKVVQLPSQEAKVEMLLANRVDAIGGWTPDIYITLQRMGLAREAITPSLTLSKSSVRIVCHDTPEMREFLDAASDAIATVHENGKYAEIMDKFGVPVQMGK